MSNFEKLVISAPGSTANLGPGFDSIGLAVNRYTTLEVWENNKWVFVPKSKELAGIPEGKDNLIYMVAEKIASSAGMELPPCRVEVTSDIPLSRGLGSSAAAIVCGIELANQLLNLDLSMDERLREASLLEGHPDNVAASLFGGLVIGSHREEATDVIQAGSPEIDIVVYIPSYELPTKKARSVLPEKMAYKEAVLASGISNVMVAALMQNNWSLAGKMMRKDLYHQPYRGGLVPEMNDVIHIAEEAGAYGAALSGAGPTIICFAPREKGQLIQQQLQKAYTDASIVSLKVDHVGLTYDRVISKQKQPF